MKRLILVLVLFLTFLPTKESVAYDSLLEYETQSHYEGIIDFLMKVIPDFLECVTLQSVMDFNQLNNNCIPRLINADPNFDIDCNDSKNPEFGVGRQILSVALPLGLLAAAVASFYIPFVGPIISIGLFIGLIQVLSPCFASYILAPHEYFNAILGYLDCEKIGSSVINKHPKALSSFDVPFFYNCLDEAVPGNLKVSDKALLDKHYGNMNQAGSPYCQGPNAELALNRIAKKGNLQTNKVKGINFSDIGPGSMIVASKPFLLQKLFNSSSSKICDLTDDVKLTLFTRNEIKTGQEKDNRLGYFRLASGRVKLCATSTFGSFFRVGCTSVAPPIEQTEINLGHADKTRCEYFLGSRSDLQSLGFALNRGKSSETGFSPVGLFLSGDLHVMSTVVGCLQDLLAKIVIGSSSKKADDSFLYQVQKAFANIVKVILIIYISVIGIKIMTAPQAPQMGEVGLYVIKFASVIVFTGIAGPNIWYNDEGDKTSGLYSMIIEAANGLSDKVIQGTNNLSPVPMCYYDYGNGQNLLSEREVPSGKYGNLQGTKGFIGKNSDSVKLTLWDYLDCKIVNYLNFNSCKFTLGNIMGLWLGTFFFFNFKTIVLGLLMLIFSVVIFINVIRFVHLSVVSLFATTILILISPIMISFVLFEYTKQTFQTWLKTILGYILYPALVLSFIALMIATFDSIFYGKPVKPDCTKTANCTIKDICGENPSDNNSIYCVISVGLDKKITNLNANLCSVRDGSLTSLFNVTGIENYFTKKNATETGDIVMNLFSPLGKLVLFAMLFHNMMAGILNFFEGMLSVYGLSSLTFSGAAMGRAAFSAAAAIATKPVKGAVAGGKAIAKKFGKK